MSYNNLKSSTIRGEFKNLNYENNSIKASAYFQNDVSISGQLYTNNINTIYLNGYILSSLVNSLSGSINNNFRNQNLINNSLSGLVFNNFTNQYLINNSLSGLILSNFRNQNLINNSLSGLIFNNFTNQYLINNSLSGLIFNNFINSGLNNYIISNNLYNSSLSSIIYYNYNLAGSTYATKTALNNYLLISSGASTYLSINNASLQYSTINDASLQYTTLSDSISNIQIKINDMQVITNKFSWSGWANYLTLNTSLNLTDKLYFSPTSYITIGSPVIGYKSVICTNLLNLPYLDISSSIQTEFNKINTLLTGAFYDSTYLKFSNNLQVLGYFAISTGVQLAFSGTNVQFLSLNTLSYLDATSSIQTQFNTITTNYLTTSSASSTYLSINNASSSYLTISNAISTYVTKPTLNNYLTTTSASSTYATITTLNNYLLSSTAASTYATITTLNNYLLSSTAASTYATISNLSNYLTISSALSTYATTSTLNNYVPKISPSYISSGNYYSISGSYGTPEGNIGNIIASVLINSMNTVTYYNMSSITLPTGVWTIHGNITIVSSNNASMRIYISNTSLTPNNYCCASNLGYTTSVIALSLQRTVCCTSSTTFYFVGINYSGSAFADGNIVGQFYAVKIA